MGIGQGIFGGCATRRALSFTPLGLSTFRRGASTISFVSRTTKLLNAIFHSAEQTALLSVFSEVWNNVSEKSGAAFTFC